MVWRSQALLRLLKHDPGVRALLNKTPTMRKTFPSPHVEQFSQLRLLEGCPSTAVKELNELLVRGLLQNPPHYLLWLRNHPLSENIVRYVTDPTASAKQIISAKEAARHHLTDERHQNSLMVLRGLLAYDLLKVITTAVGVFRF